MMTDLKSLDARETEEWAKDLGLDAYRSRQVRHWLFRRLAASWDEMRNLPRSVRSVLAENGLLAPLSLSETQASVDGTRKHLFRTMDGLFIESVLIPERGHFTLCISSQAGCAMGCRFCLTARQGLRRDLWASEIVEQVIQVKRGMEKQDRLTNIVFMGMGEPLANYRAVVKAIGTLVGEDGLDFSHRRVTLSTCGLVPGIRELGKDVTVNLAVSLNAADDETRSMLMPVNRRYPLKDLIRACREFPLPNRRMITFEYILMDGVNDRDRDARGLCRLLAGLRAKVNLIPYNPHPGAGFRPSPPDRVLRFQEILVERHLTAIIRKSKGRDIMAACGQLSGRGSQSGGSHETAGPCSATYRPIA